MWKYRELILFYTETFKAMPLYNDELLIRKTFTQKQEFPIIEKDILIISNEKLNDNLRNMIINMMSACKIEAHRFTNIDLLEEKVEWKKLALKVKQVKTVFLFGHIEKELNLSVNFIGHQLNHFDQKHWIKTYPLHEIDSNKDKKMAFWEQVLQPYFLGKKQ